MNKQEIEKAIEELKYQEDMRSKGISYQVDNLVVSRAISALEKQIPKRPIEQSTDEKTHFKCICGSIQKTVYKDGYRMGAEREYCDRCGQAIDWGNEDE